MKQILNVNPRELQKETSTKNMEISSIVDKKKAKFIHFEKIFTLLFLFFLDKEAKFSH